jgi:hypothetical protein
MKSFEAVLDDREGGFLPAWDEDRPQTTLPLRLRRDTAIPSVA